MLKFFLSLLNMKIKYIFFEAMYYFFSRTKNFSKINVAQKYVAGNFDLNQSYLRKRGVQDNNLYPGYRLRIPNFLIPAMPVKMSRDR